MIHQHVRHHALNFFIIINDKDTLLWDIDDLIGDPLGLFSAYDR